MNERRWTHLRLSRPCGATDTILHLESTRGLWPGAHLAIDRGRTDEHGWSLEETVQVLQILDAQRVSVLRGVLGSDARSHYVPEEPNPN